MIQFVTGTDTGVGKTAVTAALVAAHRAKGRTVAVVKPAQTGVGPDEPGDLQEITRLVGPVTTLELVRLPHPLAPTTAARLADMTLPELSEVSAAILELARNHEVVLVEGAGGILVPLGPTYNLLEIGAALDAEGPEVEFVVVARAGLGTLNHSALTVRAIQQDGMSVAGVVIGSWPSDPDLAETCNLRDLPALTEVPVLGRLPDGAPAMDPVDFADAAPGWLPSLS